MHLSFEHIQAFGTLAAALAALIALFVAFDQGGVTRAQQQASVMPIFDAEIQLNDNGDTVEPAVTIRNDGVGPAFLESLRILSEGVPMETWDQFNTVIFPEALSSADIFNGATVRGVRGAGRRHPVVSVTWNRDEANEEAFLDLLKRIVFTGFHIQIETSYCSVFEQCWIAEPGDSVRAASVQSHRNAGADVYAQLCVGRTFGDEE